MSTRTVLAIFLAVACIDVGLCGGSSGNARTVTKENWEGFLQEQRENNRPALVMFHVGWCKACQRTFPLFANASETLKEEAVGMDFAHADCTDDKALCQKYEVQGYPTIKLFFPESEKPPQAFKGQRTLNGFVKYAKRMTSPPIQNFTSFSELEKALEQEAYAAFITTEKSAKGIKPLAEKWMDRHLIASAPQLADLIPGKSVVPEGARLAVVSLPKQQWAGVGTGAEAQPAVSFYSGPLDDETAMNSWLVANRFPGVWSINELNFYDFTHADQSTALVAVDGEGATEELEKQIRLAQASESLSAKYFFGVLNASHWAEELKVFNIHPHELPRVLVTEQNFDLWVEDVNELRATELVADLESLAAGAPLLRQGKTLVTKIFFWKRSGWRYALRKYDYAQQGPSEAASVIVSLVSLAVLALVILWGCCACCRVMLMDDEPDFSHYRPPDKKRD